MHCAIKIVSSRRSFFHSVDLFASNRSWHYELHEDVLGFMWVTLCANWQGFKLTMTTKTLIGWFWMGQQPVLAYIPKYLIVSLHFFALIFVCYKNSIPPEIMWFGAGGGQIWHTGGWKVGFTPQPIKHGPPHWQQSNSTAMGSCYHSELSLIVANEGVQEHMKNTPIWGVSRPPLAVYAGLTRIVYDLS